MYAFGILKTEFGKFSFGRISTDIDSAGLQTLGYVPTWGMGTQGYIFDHDTEREGMIYRNDWDNGFGLKVFYSKLSHFQPTDEVAPRDADHDKYSIEPYYKWENGGASLALQYERNMYASTLAAQKELNYFFTLNPAFMHKFDVGAETSLTFHAEAKYSNGKYKNQGPNNQTHRQDGFGAYLDMTLGYPSGTASLAGWWFDGDGEKQAAEGSTTFNTSPNRHNLVHAGQAFYPFVVFYEGHTSPTRKLGDFGGKQKPGHWAAAVLGNHKFTDSLTLNYGIGYFMRTRGASLADGRKISKQIGTEFDLGIVYKFLEKVQFSSNVGILATGPYYRERYLNDHHRGAVWAWGNELLFNF
jgi:hypothetical protein